MRPVTEPQQWSSGAVTAERSLEASTLPSATPSLLKAGGVCTDSPRALPRRDWGFLKLRFADTSPVTVPAPPPYRRVHSRASQVRPPSPATPPP